MVQEGVVERAARGAVGRRRANVYPSAYLFRVPTIMEWLREDVKEDVLEACSACCSCG